MQGKARPVEAVAKVAKRPAKPKTVVEASKPAKIEVPAGFVCPVCEAKKAKNRAKMKAYRLRKKGV